MGAIIWFYFKERFLHGLSASMYIVITFSFALACEQSWGCLIPKKGN